MLMVLINALGFLYVDAGQCRRHVDAGNWRDCSLNQRIKKGVANIPPARELPGTDIKSPYVIVSEGMFPLTEHLERPYCRCQMEEREIVFSYQLSRACCVGVQQVPLLPGQHAAWSWPVVSATPSCISGYIPDILATNAPEALCLGFLVGFLL